MPVTGIKRYFRLFKHVQNPSEYFFHKQERKNRSLHFVTKPNPIQFEVPESLYQVFKEIFMADVYEIDTLVKELPSNPVVVDIGANAGFFDFILLSKSPKARVYAFEPMPANVQRLNDTIEKNSLIKEQIKLYQMAVTGMEKEYLEIFAEDTDDNQVVASVFSGFNKSNTKGIRVPCISLETIFSTHQLDKIDVLKMDCEGSEYDIIYNTNPQLIQKIKQMVVEVHDIDKKENNIQAFAAYLQNLGFKITYEPINSFCYALEAEYTL